MDDIEVVDGHTLRSLVHEVKQLREEQSRLNRLLQTLLDRLEIDDKRRQNAAIRTHQAVPAFKTVSTASTSETPSVSASAFSFTPPFLARLTKTNL